MIWYYVVPLAPVLALVVWRVPMRSAGQLLSGATIFTALLFGLLILIFNTAVTLRKDGDALTSAHDLRRLIQDLRANVTYAAAVAVVLALVLVAAAAVSPPGGALHWGWTPPVAWLALHLALTLLTVLRRLRTAFNYIAR